MKKQRGTRSLRKNIKIVSQKLQSKQRRRENFYQKSKRTSDWDGDLNTDNLGKEEYFAENRHDTLSKSLERLSIEKDPTKENKSNNQDQTNRRRKREEYERDQKRTETFINIKQYTLEQFFIKNE